MTTPVPDVPAMIAVPLPYRQRQLWLSDQLSAHKASHLVPECLGLDGELDVCALREALTAIVARHEILRTSIGMLDGTPIGLIRSAECFEMIVEDLSGDPDLELELEAVLLTEATTPLDLSRQLPIRARLLRLAEQRHALCLTVHHAAYDDYSRRLLYRELSELYAGFRSGQPVSLPPVQLQYREAAALAEARNADDMDEQLEFWRRRLSGMTPFELPTDRPRTARRDGSGAAITFTVPPETVTGLADIGRGQGATLAVVLFTACQVLLSRHTGRADVTMGTTIAQRDDPETAQVIGPFINMLVLRGDVTEDPPFTTLVERTLETALDVYDNSSIPFEVLAEELESVRDPCRTPLFQILVGCAAGRRELPVLPEVHVTEIPLPAISSKYDFYVWFDRLDDADGGLACEVAWNSSLYDYARMRRCAEHLRAILTHVAAAPHTRVSDIPLITASELAQIERLACYPAGSARHGELCELLAEHVPVLVGPADDVWVYVLDAAQRPVPPGAVGELCLNTTPANSPLIRTGLRCRFDADENLILAETASTASTTGTAVSAAMPGAEQDTWIAEALCEIWADALGVDRVGMDDNFFALGGHSLLVIRAMNRMREYFDLELPLSLIVEHPTPTSAANRIDEIAAAAGWP